MVYNKKDLRIFAFILSLILALLSSKFSKTNNLSLGGILLALSLAAFAIGLATPILIAPVYRVASFIGRILGFLITTVLLAIIFYCVFTPIGVILRTTSRDILGLKIERGKASYWIARKEKFIKPENLEKQY